MSKLTFKIQAKNGRYVVDTLRPASSLQDLQKVIHEKSDIAPEEQKILCGYPPKEVSSYAKDTTLQRLAIHSGDVLVVEKVENQNPVRERSLEAPQEAVLRREVVPADNSCLFKSISILLDGRTRETTSELRDLVGGIIFSDPAKYNSVFLGRPNMEYVEWIMKNDSWGGGIELSIFSEHFKVEIAVVDIQSQRIDLFGQNGGYENRILLIYDGIHYDPLVLATPSGAVVQKVFSVADSVVLAKAQAIAKDACKMRQFTDVHNITVRCLVCGKGLAGPAETQKHAMDTGHINFSEVSSGPT
ncbi:hypothetical protein EMCRGX_G010043 [Ephydatia muelleri]|eukprot:Em0003g1359a